MLAKESHPANREWAAAHVANLPYRWKKRLFNKWEKTRAGFDALALGDEGKATRAAAGWLLETLDKLQTVNIPLDASDSDICERAEQMSAHCNSLAEIFHDKESLRDAMARVCAANKVKAPAGKKMEAGGAIARMVDALWWRRQLRKVHAKSVEGAAISIGYVNKTRDIYVSNESVTRRRQQNRRNEAMLEATRARNVETGQEYKLAELAAKGTSNKEIKRGELMTRIAGFERIAVDSDHVGLFLTMTAPSRMHKWRTVAGGKVVENAKYDGTLPNEAQAHHAAVFARIRSCFDRAGFAWYGFRIAEPNHDGTPHWHLLVFFDKKWPGGVQRAAFPRVCAIVRRYALGAGEVVEPSHFAAVYRRFPYRYAKDAAEAARPKAERERHVWAVNERRRQNSERGAKAHRVDFKMMDAAKGTAAGYIAKYVSKNIDGYRVDKDLFGNDAISTARRVEAWAATWNIRQFQQVGGPPVGPWRELRRVKELPDDAPEHLRIAHSACNKVAAVEGETASVAWDRYVKAQGGAFCGRGYRIKIAKEETGEVGRYGEPVAARPVGVETVGVVIVRDGIVTYEKTVQWLVKSVRYTWEIIRGRSGNGKRSEAKPWTCVNNCTQVDYPALSRRMNESTKNAAQAINGKKFVAPAWVDWPSIVREGRAVEKKTKDFMWRGGDA